ncbi:MAG: glycosyltransferase family 2 protein, partial [Candidatus Latescibacteria bacterium]|nr:glycosyltransferase family 2 protein [Candidatus Latescibacterota bacterium]
MDTLSVIIITYNEEPDIEACLESVAWADEIVVVDCGSTDQTVEMCRRYTDRVYQVERHGSGQQKQEALDRATRPWVLNVDADERVPLALKQEIQEVLGRPAQCDGYCIPRRSRFLGRTIRHAGWGDDRPLR